MKGFFSWFKNNTKLKRWMIIILIGMILVCYGISNILIAKELKINVLIKIIVSFVFGLTLAISGLVFMQKRTIEIIIESEKNKEEKGINLKTLIFDKNVYEKGPKIVVIGGGVGINTVLQGLKKYTSNITAIVTVSSYGNKQSNSRKQLELLPIDDIKDSIIALAKDEDKMKELLNYEFNLGNVKEISFGDLYISVMNKIQGDFSKSIEKSSEILSIVGKVLPVTLEEMNICAELNDGTVITEKSKISENVYEHLTKINRIYLNPSNCKPAPGVIEAIADADAIVIGPRKFIYKCNT